MTYNPPSWIQKLHASYLRGDFHSAQGILERELCATTRRFQWSVRSGELELIVDGKSTRAIAETVAALWQPSPTYRHRQWTRLEPPL
mgnify:CR=1 FL=1